MEMHTHNATDDWEKEHSVRRQLFHCSEGVFMHSSKEYWMRFLCTNSSLDVCVHALQYRSLVDDT